MAAPGQVWNNMSTLININWKTQYSIGFLILIALNDVKKETLWNKFYIQEIKTQLLSPSSATYTFLSAVISIHILSRKLHVWCNCYTMFTWISWYFTELFMIRFVGCLNLILPTFIIRGRVILCHVHQELVLYKWE